MCGIAGIISINTSLDALNALLEPIIHRGETEFRYEQAILPGYGALGMHRLAIVDEAGGKQPVISQNKEAYCVFNGEIYNHKEIKINLANDYPIVSNCDSEVVLNA